MSIQDEAKIIYKAKTVLRFGPALLFLVRYKKIYFTIPAFENQDKVMEAIQNNSDCVYKCLY